MTKTPIYLVIGETGEYDDHHDWIVCAYQDKKAAEEHAEKAQQEANRLFSERGNEIFTYHNSPFDDSMHIDYTGTTYYVAETDLHTN